MPSAMRGKSPASVMLRDVGSEAGTVRAASGPSCTASETMLAFHAPPDAVIAPVT